ncbi:MAG: imidazole glycerol phosphate synthase subunit HisH [Vampirovibrio sp.]|nr:imidazole glycerol phosphate synthase subunit HisH [Vampirovibrio sp.]
MIDLVDYGGGNIGSIQRCLERLQIPYQMTDGNALPSGDRPLVFPGVGAFGASINHLTQSGLLPRLKSIVQSGTPYLGICIGLQVLFDSSEEAEGLKGLGVIPGKVVKFDAKKVSKIPQIGWNHIAPPTNSTFTEEPTGHVYFVNSFHPSPEDPAMVLYEANYSGQFCAAVKHQNITAFQFHPEKSGPFGHQLIQRWHNNYAL